MHLTPLNDKIYLFTAENQKDLALTFFRVQEFYESPHPELNGAKFSTYDFLNRVMDNDGNIEYFNYWAGFNIPGEVVNEWWKKQDVNQATTHELVFFNLLNDAGVDFSQTYYVIGTLEKDKRTIKHEIAHALYYTDQEYYKEMFNLTSEFMFLYKDQYQISRNSLINMGYCNKVLDDEIQAYMSSEKISHLAHDFKLDIKEMKPLIKKYRKVLSKYNKFKV
jgi:hypothetical protein